MNEEENKNKHEDNSNNPLHGIKLKQILEDLEAEYGWELLSQFLEVRCFAYDPSINSCLKFFRKTPWARAKLEKIYLKLILKLETPEEVLS